MNICPQFKNKINKLQACIQAIKKHSAQLMDEENLSRQELFEQLYKQRLITKAELDKAKAILMKEQQGKVDGDRDKHIPRVKEEDNGEESSNESTQGTQYKSHFGSTTAFLLEEEELMLKQLP